MQRCAPAPIPFLKIQVDIRAALQDEFLCEHELMRRQDLARLLITWHLQQPTPSRS